LNLPNARVSVPFVFGTGGGPAAKSGL